MKSVKYRIDKQVYFPAIRAVGRYGFSGAQSDIWPGLVDVIHEAVYDQTMNSTNVLVATELDR